MTSLSVALPAMSVEATVRLDTDHAPSVARSVFDAVASPVETRTSHACFSGHQVFCLLPRFPQAPPVENSTVRVTQGDVLFFYAAPYAYAWMQKERARMAPGGPAEPVHELAFVYGDADLQHFASEGWYGSLVGRVTSGLEEFARACGRTLSEGSTTMRISQALPHAGTDTVDGASP